VGRKNGKKNSSIYSSLGLLESECWPPPLGSIGKHHPLSCWGAYIHLYFFFYFSSFPPLYTSMAVALHQYTHTANGLLNFLVPRVKVPYNNRREGSSKLLSFRL
jgi:hypothetical protein